VKRRKRGEKKKQEKGFFFATHPTFHRNAQRTKHESGATFVTRHSTKHLSLSSSKSRKVSKIESLAFLSAADTNTGTNKKGKTKE
jgi:hypothetical protein